MNKNRGISKIKSNIISNYMGQAYSMLVALASMPIYMQYLGSEAYGLIAFFILLQNITIFLDFGLSVTISRLIIKAKVTMNGFSSFGNILKIAEIILMIAAIVIVFFIYISAGYISNNWINPVILTQEDITYSLKLMSLIIGLKLYTTFYRTGIYGFEDQIWNNKAIIFINTLKYIGSIAILIFFSKKITAFFNYQVIVSFFEVALLRHRFYKNMPKEFSRQGLKEVNWVGILEITPFALNITYTTVIVSIIMQLDKLLLSSMISLEELGYLNVITSVTGLILIVVTPVFLSYLPKITGLANRGKAKEMRESYTQMTKIVALVTISTTAMLACNARGIIYAITGSKVAQEWSSEALVYYAIGTGFYVLCSAQYYLLNAIGNLKLYVIGCIISLVVLVPAFYFTVNVYSVLGASYVWMLYGMLWFFLWGGIVHNRMLPGFHFQWLIKDIAPLVVSVSLTSLIASYLININQNESRMLIVLVSSATGIFILLLNAFWFYEFRFSIINKIYKSKI
jgi:O-antigen/teichoic acid export membrane protein